MGRIDSLGQRVKAIEAFLSQLGFHAEQSDSNEQTHSSPEGSGNNDGAVEEDSDSGTGDNEPKEDGAPTRFLQDIKSRMDEIKREQSQMKLSDALSHVLKEKRRK